MDAQTLKDTTLRWMFGLFDHGDLDLIDEMTAEGYTFHTPRGLTTRAELPDLVGAFRSAFPDLNNTIEDQVVEGNVVVTRGTTRGTHEAPLGDLPATGRAVAVPWVTFTRFDGSRIREEWQVYDQLDMMIQLGAMQPAPIRSEQ